jgi:hypothetical protein
MEGSYLYEGVEVRGLKGVENEPMGVVCGAANVECSMVEGCGTVSRIVQHGEVVLRPAVIPFLPREPPLALAPEHDFYAVTGCGATEMKAGGIFSHNPHLWL